MTYAQCESMGKTERANMMMRAILLDEKQIQKYGHMFDSLDAYYNKGNQSAYSYSAFEADVANRKETSATSFSTGKNSFNATVERDKETLVFFSVPYDKGWSATVNGKEVEVEKVNVGFMAVPVGAGKSEIHFTYKTPGLLVGGVVSVSAFAVLLVYGAIVFVYRKKHSVTINYPEGEQLLKLWAEQESKEQEQIASQLVFDLEFNIVEDNENE
jgi:hypothetical protein